MTRRKKDHLKKHARLHGVGQCDEAPSGGEEEVEAQVVSLFHHPERLPSSLSSHLTALAKVSGAKTQRSFAAPPHSTAFHRIPSHSTALHRTPPRLHLLSILLFICFLNLCHHMLSQGDDADISPGIQASEAPARYSLRTVRAGGGAIGVAGGRKQRGNHSASAPNAIPGAAATSSASADISYAVPEAEAEEEPEADGDGFSGGDGFDDEWAAEQEVEAEAAEEVVAEEAEEEVPEAEVDAPALGLRHSSRLHRHTMNTLKSTAPATQPTGGVGAVKKSSVRGGAASAPPTRRFGFLRSQPLPNRSGPSEVNLPGSRSASNLAAPSSSKQPAPYQADDEDDELHVLPPAAVEVCGRDGCAKPDRHPGMCDVQQMPRHRGRKAPAAAAAAAQQEGPSILHGLLSRIGTHSGDEEEVVEELTAAEAEEEPVATEEEEEQPEAVEDLCGTWGCTLPDKHSGLHKIPMPPARRAAAAAGGERAAQHARQEASQQPGPSGQSTSTGEPSTQPSNGATDNSDDAEGFTRSGRRKKQARPLHLSTAGIWMFEGLDYRDCCAVKGGRSHSGDNPGIKYGERILFLLNEDYDTLAPGVLGQWKPRRRVQGKFVPADDRPPDWAPGWVPVNKHTIDADDTNRSKLCNEIEETHCHALGEDLRRIKKGSVLSEADTPAKHYMTFSDVIRIRNAGKGYCPCGVALLGHVPRGSDGHTQIWTVERKENCLMHIQTNLLPYPVCQGCNTRNNFNPITGYHTIYGSSTVDGAILAHGCIQYLPGVTEQERRARAAEIMRQRGDVGGPKAVWPADIVMPEARDDQTNGFKCRYPGCTFVGVSRSGIMKHGRGLVTGGHDRAWWDSGASFADRVEKVHVSPAERQRMKAASKRKSDTAAQAGRRGLPATWKKGIKQPRKAKPAAASAAPAAASAQRAATSAKPAATSAKPAAASAKPAAASSKPAAASANPAAASAKRTAAAANPKPQAAPQGSSPSRATRPHAEPAVDLTEEDIPEEMFQVAQILAERQRPGHESEFLTSWVGYDSSHNSWEWESNFLDPALIPEFRKKQRQQQQDVERDARAAAVAQYRQQQGTRASKRPMTDLGRDGALASKLQRQEASPEEQEVRKTTVWSLLQCLFPSKKIGSKVKFSVLQGELLETGCEWAQHNSVLEKVINALNDDHVIFYLEGDIHRAIVD